MPTKSESSKPQIDRFRETARKLGCDKSEKAFDEKLKAIAKQKPKTQNPTEDETPE